MNFTDEQRRLVQYFDGAANVMGDPLALRRRLSRELGGDPNKFLKEMSSESEEQAFQATEKVIAAVRAAFEMAPFDKTTGTGADEQNCLDALDALLVYLETQKKSTASLPTSSPPTAEALPPFSAGPSRRVMQPGSASP